MNSPPELRKVIINGGARYTSSRMVTLTVDAVDDNVVQTLIVSFDAFQTQLEFPFSSTLNLTLPGGDGVKTVYVVVADDKGSKSTVKENFIVLDQTPPYGIVGVQPPDGAVVGPDLVTISWTIAYDDTSGVALPYVLELSKDRDFSSPIKIECEKNRYDLPYENQRGTYYWRVRVWDKAGNENCTPIYSFTYNLDAPIANIRTDSEIVNTPEVFIRLSGTNLASYRYALSEPDLYRAPWVVYSGGLENIRLRLLTEGDYRIWLRGQISRGRRCRSDCDFPACRPHPTSCESRCRQSFLHQQEKNPLHNGGGQVERGQRDEAQVRRELERLGEI
jgi:hypothetical protein